MPDTLCRDCDRPIRMVKLAQWGNQRFPLDATPSLEGDYAVLGPDDAVYVKREDRTTPAPLYTDHRRTCLVNKSSTDPDRPRFVDLKIRCEACSSERVIVETESAGEIADRFASDHTACRRKAS